MNQSKYGFHQKLKTKDQKEGRYPISIRVLNGQFQYFFSEIEMGYLETSLEVQEEPKVKKLYAYSYRWEGKDMNVFIKTDTKSFEMNGILYMRDFDYDIEYPESKVDQNR